MDRLRRLARLDLDVLDEVARDPDATAASVVVAAVSTVLAGLGGWLWWMSSGLGDVRAADSVFVKSVLFGSVASLGLWGVWLVVVAWVLQRLAKTMVQVGPLVRAAGMATVPLAFGILMVVPVVSFSLGLLAIAGWVLLTQSAIERATGIRGGEVILANLSGFAVWAAVLSLLTTGDNQFAPGIFLAESLWDLVASAS
jgi:hypothetical protein